jgi:hypothetical protein
MRATLTCDEFLFREVRMRIRVQAAFHAAAVIFSMPVAAAEISPNVAEWPTGDVWPSEAAQHGASRTADQQPIPGTPAPEERVRPTASNLTPAQYKLDIPTEFKFNITLTIRRIDRPIGRRGQTSGTAGTRASRAASLRDLR